MGYNDDTCYQRLTAAGMSPICDKLPDLPHHCRDVTRTDSAAHQYCAQFYDPNNPESDKYIYAPVRTVVCLCRDKDRKVLAGDVLPPGYDDCSPLEKTRPIPGGTWVPASCVCCCGCMAYDTPIAVPSGYKPIQQIAVGESVLAATVTRTQSGTTIAWNANAVTFSTGVGGASVNPAMIYLAFGTDQSAGDLICSTDQVFMLATGKLITAARLGVGDELMDRDGNPVPVKTIALGSYKGGVHHISTGELDFTNIKPDNHLLLAAGVVAGDYTLQLNFDALPADWKAPDLSLRHEIGTQEYHQAHGPLMATASLVFGAVPASGARRMEIQQGVFNIYGAQPAVYEDAVSLFTRAQAYDILENGSQLPVSNPVPRGSVTNLFRIFSGFHPSITFYLDWYNFEPNVYAFEQYGRKTIVVTGGLARMSGFAYEGIAMAIAHGIARFADTQPKAAHGYTATAAADYYAFGNISRYLWYWNNWLDMLLEGSRQVTALFALISPANAAGSTVAPLDEPSTACRQAAIRAAIADRPLPECAGGPVQPKIALQSVTATTKGLILTLSVAPTTATATDTQNYELSPETPISSAKQDPTKDFIIYLEADLAEGKTYTVTIRNLTSIVGSGVDPQHSSQDVTVE